MGGQSEATDSFEQPSAGRADSAGDIAALSDSRFIAALVALIANDHWLKAEYGNWLTGKVSDIAGLIMLPIVIVSALRLARLRPNPQAILAVVGVWFTAIKLWSAAAAATERLAEAMTGVEHQIIVDPTDVVGLVGLGVAVRIINAPRPLIAAPAVRLALLTLGLVATVATSSVEFNPPNDLIVEQSTGEVSAIPSEHYSEPFSGCREAVRAEDAFDADADFVTNAAVQATPARCDDFSGVGTFELQACPKDGGIVCIRARGAAIEVTRDGSTWKTEWSLDRSSPTTYYAFPENGYSYDPRVNDIVVDRWGTTHVTYYGLPYLTRTADGTWSQPFSDYRPISFVALSAAFAMAISALAIAYRRSQSRRWWIVPAIAMAGYVAIVVGFYNEDIIMPIGQMAGLALFGAAIFFCSIVVGRYRKEIPGHGANVALAAASAIPIFIPFLVWKYAVNVSFAYTWAWVPIAALCGFAIDALVGRRIASRPVPPPPKPVD